MRRKKPIIFIVLLLGGGFLLYGIFNGELPRIVRNYFSASLVAENSSLASSSTDAIYNPKYSFSEDDDKDGLSNAKEIIYGADSRNPDTDGDGFQDGEEVKNGYDPSRAGNIPLEERFKENDTIRYFSWAQKRTGADDPRLETRLVEEFIANEADTSLPPLEVHDSELARAENDEYDTILAYFRELGSVPLPTVASSYFDVAGEAILENFENVDKALNQLTAINGQLRQIATPPVATSLQKKYIQMVSTLKTLFADLYSAKVDPVRLSINLERGKNLIALVNEIAKETESIVKRYQIEEQAQPQTP